MFYHFKPKNVFLWTCKGSVKMGFLSIYLCLNFIIVGFLWSSGKNNEILIDKLQIILVPTKGMIGIRISGSDI
tara:strand:- start:151 stop:369 length:219 start_codon:yes stop_codon:yes gene_type:complete